jgi:hypothetical protein
VPRDRSVCGSTDRPTTTTTDFPFVPVGLLELVAGEDSPDQIRPVVEPRDFDYFVAGMTDRTLPARCSLTCWPHWQLA